MASPTFTAEEQATLAAARRAVQFDRATVVHLMYENPFAKAGGLSAVGERLPAALAALGQRVVVVSPLHCRLDTAPGAFDVVPSGEVVVPYLDGGPMTARVYETTRRGVRWLLVALPGYFQGTGHSPYTGELAADSVAFACALPYVLRLVGLGEQVVVHAHEWQMVPSALTCKLAVLSGLWGPSTVLATSHNPYDAPLPAALLGRITRRAVPGYTFYQAFLPLTDGPLTTVSRGFAADCVSDPLLTECLADHLQDQFRARGVVGIDNGLFLDPTGHFCPDAEAQARGGDVEPLLVAKRALRAQALEALKAVAGSAWGRLDPPHGQQTPLFFAFGRLDFQKGFDVLAAAIRALPSGWARFVIAASAQRPDDPRLDDLRRLAISRAGDVLVFPRRMTAGYAEVMAGATFAVMPSLFEPWGAASEPMLRGTPVIARRTGGLPTQVIDGDPTEATGLLFRERTPSTGWGELLRTPIAERPGLPLFDGMVEALGEALRRGARLAADEATYGRVLANLAPMARRFDWETTAERYRAWYRAAIDALEATG